MGSVLVMSVIQIIAAIAAIVLIFIGLRMAIKNLDRNNASKMIPQEILKKSTKIIVFGVLCYALSRFAANYFPMKEERYEETMILIQSLWQATYTLGFTALIPYIINKLQVSRITPPQK